MAYAGSELATSLTKVSYSKNVWSDKVFCRLSDFHAVMSRTKYQCIRSSLRFCPSYEHEVSICDALWHSMFMLKHLCCQAITIAVPGGVI